MKWILTTFFAVILTITASAQWRGGVINPFDDWHTFRDDSTHIRWRAEDKYRETLDYYRHNRKNYYDDKDFYETLAQREAEKFFKEKMDSLRQATRIMYTEGDGYVMPYDVYIMYLKEGKIKPFVE